MNGRLKSARPSTGSSGKTADGSSDKGGFFFWGTILYLVMFYSQVADRFPFLQPARPEFVLGTILLCGAVWRIVSGRVSIRENPVHLAAFAFLAIALYTVPFAEWRLRALETFVRLFKFFSVYLMMVVFVRTERQLKILFATYLSMVGLIILQPFFLSLAGKGYVFNNHMWRLAGVTGYFHHPNQLGGMTAANLPFLYLFLKRWRHPLARTGVLLAMAAFLNVVMKTQSRTAFVGVMVFGLLVVLNSRHRVRTVAVLTIATVFLWIFAPSATKERFLTLGQVDEVVSGQYGVEEAGSMAARWILVKHSFQVFMENPIIGVGLDCFNVVSYRKWQRWIYPHNTYLQALSEMGLLGTTAFFFVIVMTFKNLARVRVLRAGMLEEADFLYFFASALRLHLMVQLAVSFFGIELYDNYWWIAGGLSVVILRVAESQAGAETVPETLSIAVQREAAV